MKLLIYFTLLFTPLLSFSQEISDSTIIKMADYNCRCEDTIKTDQTKETIKSQIMECYAKSLVTFGNNGEIPSSYMNDRSNAGYLQKRVVKELANCEKTNTLISKLNYAPIPKDSVPDELMITEDFFKIHKLKSGQVSPGMKVWNSDGNEHIQRVVDIRWVFESKKEALEYHSLKLVENSENGSLIEKEMKLQGTEELFIYRENEMMANMMQKLGVKQKQFYFLFVIENVVYKIFIGTDDTQEVKDLLFIPEEAVKRYKKYAKK